VHASRQELSRAHITIYRPKVGATWWECNYSCHANPFQLENVPKVHTKQEPLVMTRPNAAESGKATAQIIGVNTTLLSSEWAQYTCPTAVGFLPN
jgi:hypothetical protein